MNKAHKQQQAFTHYQAALQLDCQADFVAAEKEYRKSLSLDPESIEACLMLNILLHREGRAEEIDKLWRQCVKKLPEQWKPKLYRVLNLLQSARFDQGFQLREQLYQHHHHFKTSIPPPIDYPAWRGESLQGRAIVIWTEFGAGDELMLCRFASVLKRL
ncbi:MAG: hypothetical protein ACRC5A_15085, partial [Enterobacteriaceae bacterium]